MGGQRAFPSAAERHRLLRSLLSIAGSADGLLHDFALMHLYWNAMKSDYL